MAMNSTSDPSTPFRRRMPIYLLGVWIELDIATAILALAGYPEVWPYLAIMLAGQFMALTGWLAVGEDWLGSTAAAAIGLVVLSFLPIALLDLPAEARVLIVLGDLFLAVTYGVLLNLPLILARSLGWRFSFQPSPHTASASSVHQFSIRQFLLYTALVGLIAAAWAATDTRDNPRVSAQRGFTGSTVFRVARMHVSAGMGEIDRNVHIAALLVAFPIPWSLWAVVAWVRPIRAGAVSVLVVGLWCLLLGRFLGLGNLAALLLIPAVTLIVHLQALRVADYGWQRRYTVESIWSG